MFFFCLQRILLRLRRIKRTFRCVRLAEIIEANKEEIGRIESLDSGKPLLGAINYDVMQTVNIFRYYAGRPSVPTHTPHCRSPPRARTPTTRVSKPTDPSL